MTVIMTIEGREITGFEFWCWFEARLIAGVREAVGAEFMAEMARTRAEFRPVWDAMTDEERVEWILSES